MGWAAGQTNSYAYVNGDPVYGSDPLGLLNIVLGAGGSGVPGIGAEGSGGVYVTVPSKGVDFDVGLWASGGIGIGYNIGIAGMGGVIKGDVNDVRGVTFNANYSGGPISGTAMFDGNGHWVGQTIGPSAEIGISGSYAKTSAFSFGELGSSLGGWFYDHFHPAPNQCH
jgi:hypothetical protein